MLSSIIAERYAKALLAAAEQAGFFDQVLQEAAALAAGLGGDATLAAYLKRPLVRPAEKAELFSRALERRFSPVFLQFLRVVFENKRESFLPVILKQVEALADLKLARARAKVSSSRQLKPEQLEALSQALSRRLGRQVELQAVVSREMLGGLRVQVGDKVFDASLESQLLRLEECLLSQGSKASSSAKKKGTISKRLKRTPKSKKKMED
jgi:F-type H+-transporting ATPase subunit delta